MTRTAAREIAIHLSFEMNVNPLPVEEILQILFDEDYYKSRAEEDELYSEYPDGKQREYIETLARGIGEHSYELDSYIEKYSKGWKLSRISRTATAIMRTAMYEVLYMPEIPNAAAINEAVELAKKYEDADVVSFINGILGSFVRGEVTQ